MALEIRQFNEDRVPQAQMHVLRDQYIGLIMPTICLPDRQLWLLCDSKGTGLVTASEQLRQEPLSSDEALQHIAGGRIIAELAIGDNVTIPIPGSETERPLYIIKNVGKLGLRDGSAYN